MRPRRCVCTTIFIPQCAGHKSIVSNTVPANLRVCTHVKPLMNACSHGNAAIGSRRMSANGPQRPLMVAGWCLLCKDYDTHACEIQSINLHVGSQVGAWNIAEDCLHFVLIAWVLFHKSHCCSTNSLAKINVPRSHFMHQQIVCHKSPSQHMDYTTVSMKFSRALDVDYASVVGPLR